jgi:hypothetical protein
MTNNIIDGPLGSLGSGQCLYNESLSNYFLQRGTQGIDIDGVHVHVKGKFYKRPDIRTLFGFGSVHFHTTISSRHSLMKLTMIS